MTDCFALPSAPVLTLSGRVATLTLNRPAQRNRLDMGDLAQLMAHMDAVQAQPDVALLVLTARTTGQPRPVFCAGFDVGAFEAHPDGAGHFEQVANRLADLRPVTLCALNGSVHGGATDLALACDLRMGLADMQWHMPATTLGLHYYPSGLARYVSRMGVWATQRAFLTGRPFDAAQLLALGALESVCEPAQWDSTLAALVKDVLALAPLATQATKQSINELALGQWDEARLRQREHASSAGAEFAQGRAAFASRKRTGS